MTDKQLQAATSQVMCPVRYSTYSKCEGQRWSHMNPHTPFTINTHAKAYTYTFIILTIHSVHTTDTTSSASLGYLIFNFYSHVNASHMSSVGTIMLSSTVNRRVISVPATVNSTFVNFNYPWIAKVDEYFFWQNRNNNHKKNTFFIFELCKPGSAWCLFLPPDVTILTWQ